MHSLRQSFTVSYSYPVHFTNGVFGLQSRTLLEVLGASSDEPEVILCVIDEGVVLQDAQLPARIMAYADAHKGHIRLVSKPMILAGGEAGKNGEDAYRRVQSAIHNFGLCRQSYVLAIGGGAFLDLVGFAAATAHRGVRLIRLPTTVLSQGDSGIGVKNSVNAFGKKNFVGTFAPPFAVINDFAFLQHLSYRDWIAGTSEAVKVALLKDAAFFQYLEEHASAVARREEHAMQHLIHRSAELHLLHIGTGGDPFETTSSRPLDFGHWAAHKLEQMSDFALRHGEAVAIGIALDSTYSFLKGWLTATDWQRILHVFSALGFSLVIPEDIVNEQEVQSWQDLLNGLEEFREHLGGKLTMTLLHGIGNPFEVNEIDNAVMLHALDLLNQGVALQQEIAMTGNLVV